MRHVSTGLFLLVLVIAPGLVAPGHAGASAGAKVAAATRVRPDFSHVEIDYTPIGSVKAPVQPKQPPRGK